MTAAVVGGLVGGFAVLLGVAFGEWLIRCRNRREKVEELVQSLNLETVPIFYGLQASNEGDDARAVIELGNRIGDSLGKVALLAKWPTRHRETIREEAQNIIVRLTVAIIEWEQRGPIADAPDQL